MPRRFREDEEQRIRAALLQAGREIMGHRGVRKTAIDELVRHAGISKGSFYRFFSSKEALALAVLAGWEQEFHAELNALFMDSAPRGVDACADLLFTVFLELFPRRVMESGVQGLMDAEEIAYLIERAAPEHREMMDEQDLRFYEGLRPLFAEAGLQARCPDAEIIAGMRLLFDAGLSTLRVPDSGSLTAEHFQSAFRSLVSGFLHEVFETDPNETRTQPEEERA
jgi:AcrR family transcriptional regulator